MDYKSIHGKGESNFSSPTSHRMPTVSAAHALQHLASSSTRCISTGLEDLDAVLQNRDPAASHPHLCDTLPGGVSRGKVTEIYGPPGAGKTALGIQLAVNVLKAGERVCWVDSAQPLCGTRFHQVLVACTNENQLIECATSPRLLDNLTHILAPTLAHLIATISGLAQSNISLLVIDCFSTLISNAFPRTAEMSSTPKRPGVQKFVSRKFPLLQYIINALQKVAATQNIAVVVLSQCVTRVRPGAGAILIPAVNNTAWEQGLGARAALFRDWGWDDENGESVDDVRFAQVTKAEGIGVPEGRVQAIAFTIGNNGLGQLKIPILPSFEIARYSATVDAERNSNSVLPQKRKLSTAELEIPDSDAEDDEDYGWAEEDEQELPAPPPQWQGSEDILISREDQVDAEEIPDEENDEVETDKKGTVQEAYAIKNGDAPGEIEDSEDELAL